MSDLIDRQAAIAALCHRCDLVAEDCEPCTSRCDDIKILEMMPSAQPDIAERSHESAQNMQKNDLISRKAAIDAVKGRFSMPVDNLIAEVIGQLPSAQPERKTGKWIEHSPHKWGLGIVYECSECGEEIDCETYNFCPNCGVRMEGTE